MSGCARAARDLPNSSCIHVCAPDLSVSGKAIIDSNNTDGCEKMAVKGDR